MAESVLLKLKRILTGRLAGVVDQWEVAQREHAMRESLREVQRAMADAGLQASRAAKKSALASSRVMTLREQAAEFTRKARIAQGQGRAELAEALVARQIDLEAQIPIVEASERDARAEEAELARGLKALEARKIQMEADLEAFLAACAALQASQDAPRSFRSRPA